MSDRKRGREGWRDEGMKGALIRAREDERCGDSGREAGGNK